MNTDEVLVFETDPDLFPSDEIKLSCWILEENLIRPSTSLKVKNFLEPGMYIIDVHRDYGMYCKKLKSCDDELFTFANSVVSSLKDEIGLFWSKGELYEKNKLVHKRGILLYGYPGTGKTSIISLLADEIIKQNGIIFKITGPKNLFYYNTFIKDFFRKIQPDTPIITIIEDLDDYMDVSSELLDLLDGKNNIEHNVFITTSNNTEEIESTFLRPSRIDLQIEIQLPNKQIREQYLRFKNVPEEELPELLKQSEGFSLADLKELYICVYILDYSIQKAVEKIENVIEKKNYLNKSSSNNSLAI